MNKKEYKFLAYNEDIPHPTEIELSKEWSYNE